MTIFSKIIAGDIPCYKIAEERQFIAFLDINPLTKGHTLIVPKLQEPEEDYLFELSDALLCDMMVFSKKVAVAIKKAIPCKRIGVAVLGMEVPHVHLHLIPMQKEGDMLFNNPKLTLTDEEMQHIATSIRQLV